jgi:hypothetical protein
VSGAAAVLSLARASGVRLRVDEVGRLKVVGRPEMVPFEILVGLRAHKAEIIELLRAGGLGQAANDDDEAFEPVGVIVDEAGNPALPCATCGGRSFHQAPGAPWRCSGCEPPTLPGDAAALAGWSFCSLPATPDEDGPPGAAGSAQNDDSESGRAGEGASKGRCAFWRPAPALERRPGMDLAMAQGRADHGRARAGGQGLDRRGAIPAAAPMPCRHRVGPDRGLARHRGRGRAPEWPASAPPEGPGARFGVDPHMGRPRALPRVLAASRRPRTTARPTRARRRSASAAAAGGSRRSPPEGPAEHAKRRTGHAPAP